MICVGEQNQMYFASLPKKELENGLEGSVTLKGLMNRLLIFVQSAGKRSRSQFIGKTILQFSR